MAIRTIREIGDEILTKSCKAVTLMSPRMQVLAGDMLETMYAENGVGLAAPQVGVLKQLVVVDVGQGPMVLVNPEIVEQEGEQTGQEGCLSVPGKWGNVTRPEKIRVHFQDINLKPQELSAEGLLARAICHEVDHLRGELYVDKVVDGLYDVPPEEDEET